MAKHRAPVVKRQRTRKALAFAGRALRGVRHSRTLRVSGGVAWHTTRTLALWVGGIVWLAVALVLFVVASAGGKDAATLRTAVVDHMLSPLGQRVQRISELPPVPPVQAHKARTVTVTPASRARHAKPEPVLIDADPSLWPTTGQLTDLDDLDVHEEESIAVLAMRGLMHKHSTSRAMTG